MSKRQMPFQIGDKVRVIRKDAWYYEVGLEGHITKGEWVRHAKQFEYFIDGNGWYNHDALQLVKRATWKSVQKALRIDRDES